MYSFVVGMVVRDTMFSLWIPIAKHHETRDVPVGRSNESQSFKLVAEFRLGGETFDGLFPTVAVGGNVLRLTWLRR